ncbi:hypothetical protein C2845_PM10G05310 [Panicum miliaceum]|uniref:Uncharacterized protein n=1 Tax=Panicum miliaceum TaxID=4540 RepID=A0A3L6PI27_PANMI|nr:hypothetical protein C2845_PM10G05310 [Panicum miliaceum]
MAGRLEGPGIFGWKVGVCPNVGEMTDTDDGYAFPAHSGSYDWETVTRRKSQPMFVREIAPGERCYVAPCRGQAARHLAENVPSQSESAETTQGQLPKSNDPIPGASLERTSENEPMINPAQNTQIIISDSSATTSDPTNVSALQDTSSYIQPATIQEPNILAPLIDTLKRLLKKKQIIKNLL